MDRGIKIQAQAFSKWNYILIAAFAYFYWLMLKITLYYVPYNTNVAFLQIKQTEVTSLPEYRYLFYAHVYTSIFVLLFGFLQFIIPRAGNGKVIHRFSGYQYVFLILAFAAPSGIYMGLHANGGLPSKLSFILLGTLWWVTTWVAMIKIRKGKFLQHRDWMIRSFALCLSAVTLRFWKVIIVYLFHLPPIDVYQVIAWLGWVPNLIIAEILIYNYNKP
ncbi:DUF2306 domain-containing protein [Flavobacterium zepuense]|nr:DUF2306 domain-containing protein [Flavobacterium zepuense]